jgi:MacB-like protein/FtsX-like permease family protein
VIPGKASGLVPALRRTVTPALRALRTYWGTTLLLLATAATALAALLPVTSLVASAGGGLSTRLGLAPWRGADLELAWSALAWSPTASRQAALHLLFRLLLGVAAGVLTVAVLTVISLSAARASERAFEVRVRRAVGASRGQLLAAGLFEGGAIAAGALAAGGVLGMAAAQLAIAAWPGFVGPPTFPGNLVAVVATLCGIVVGAVLPVALPRRVSALPGPTGKPLELVVPALQLGLSLTVLTAAALLEREAGRLTAPARATAEAGEVFQVTTPESSPGARAARYASLLERFGDPRPFSTVSLTSPGTLVGLGMVDVVTTDCGSCSLGGLAFPLHPVAATHHLVSADTFRVLALSVVAGRRIVDADRWNAPRVAVVSQSLAERHFERGGAVGRHILIGHGPGEWYMVVGVVRDQPPTGFGGGVQPRDAVYLSVLQHPARTVDLLVRAPADSGAMAAVARRLREALGGAGARVSRASLSGLRAAEAAPVRWFGGMLRMEGWVLLMLATVGTFVVMRLWVVSLLYELALRRAVGARRRAIIGFVLSRAAGVAIGGVAIGLWAGLLVWGTLATVFAGLPPWDVHAALRIAPLLAAATLAGALLPAWRAARAAPTTRLSGGPG